MHKLLASFLIVLTGWTLSSHVMVLSGQSLQKLIIIAPFVICSLAFIYHLLPKLAHVPYSTKELRPNIVGFIGENNASLAICVCLCLTPIVLYLSWFAFWAVSTSILTYCICLRWEFDSSSVYEIEKPKRWERAVVLCLSVAAVVLTLSVVRSDLDDAFYVAVASFASGNPSQPLLAFDPMHGDAGLPLIFASYRFASFELLAGAVAHLLGIPAMDVIYKLLPPLWAIFSVLCIFLLAQEYMPKRWLLLGIVTFLLIVILGESHRAPANMMFVRMFQGKAVYLSVIVPAIFYLTARYLSSRGTSADLFLIGCSQLTAIGLSNFGMLAAPIAGAGALISNIPVIEKASRKKLWGVLVTLTIPLPYLVAVAVESSWGSAMAQSQSESALQVWTSVFGTHQQYLVGILLLIGPVLARDSITRWRLAVPPLLLFALYLNPWLSNFISKNITTPPVYWRVVWSFPILIFAAASVCIVIDRLIDGKERRFFPAILSAIVIVLLIFSLPLNTLRPGNIDSILSFASRKVNFNDYAVAEKAIQVNGTTHRLLAPDQISGLISRFEVHPKLVSVRGFYLDMLAPAFGHEAYRQRRVLHDFVSGIAENDKELVRTALSSLNVSTIVIPQINERNDVVEFLKSENFQMIEAIKGYSIWCKVLQ